MLSFEKIVKMTQPELKKAVMSELNSMGYRTRTKKGFVYAKGNVPVLLVAHLDTVHKEPVKTICYSNDGTIIMSPEGIGGDDRAGVFMILKIIKKHRCHVLFCEDEEKGGIGATEFAKSDIKPDVNFIVELDRRGDNDAVFYDCDNPDFTAFVTEHGFVEDFGSFSDISIVAPELGVAAVNISAGYYHEHTRHEYVDFEAVRRNIERVSKMVSQKTAKFEYIEAIRYRGMFGRRYYEDMYGFDRYYARTEASDIKALMLLPDSCHLKMRDGEMKECDWDYMLDDSGRVYEHLYDLDVAVEVPDCEAHTENGMPVKFDDKEAIGVEVVSREYAEELEYELMCDDDPALLRELLKEERNEKRGEPV